MPGVDIVARPQRPTITGTARLVDYRPTDGTSALAARCSVAFPGGWIVSQIPIFRRTDGSLSAGVPSLPILAADGSHARDADGKKRYAPIITFADAAARDRWNNAIIDALHAAGIGIAP
jgi:hypothetical protein